MTEDGFTFLDGINQQMLDRVITLCNINSGTGNLVGIREVSQHLIEWFGELGGEFHLKDIPERESINSHGEIEHQPLGQALQFIKRPDVRPRILMCIHMDTVYQPNHPFQKCQMLDDGRLNGPGVADAKGGLMVMLHALLAWEKMSNAEQLGWEVIINPDEELGSPGSNQFLRSRAAEADWGLLFEPTLPDGTLVSWRKGSGNFDFVVRGVSAHSGRDFAKGRNAIVALSRFLASVDQLNVDPEITYNVGRVEGGGALNMVPDLAIGRVNVRVKTVDQQKEVIENFERLMDSVRKQDGITIERFGEFSSPTKPLDERTQSLQKVIEQCGEELGIEVRWQGTGGASDGNKFAAAGLPNIDTMGPRGGNIHSSEEYLICESLEERARLALAVLSSLARSNSEN